MEKFKPLADRVLIKAAAAEEKTVGGIIIPDSAKEKPLRGEVIAVGSSRATWCCMASMPAQKSRSTARSTSSCVKATCWE